eukprot:scaffold2549_cov108-Isochrysis_galbana.AAC.9
MGKQYDGEERGAIGLRWGGGERRRVALASHEPSALRRQAGRLLRAPARPPPLPVGGRVETASGAVVFKVKGICCFDRWPAAVRIILFAASPTGCAITAFVGNACAFHRAWPGSVVATLWKRTGKAPHRSQGSPARCHNT